MILKKIREFTIALMLFGFLGLGTGSAAFAQPVFKDGISVGLTTFYNNPMAQEQGVNTLKDSGFDVEVPLNIKDLGPKSLGDGSFQNALLDFTEAVPSIPGTNTRITFSGPMTTVNGAPATSSIYSVVAGKVDTGTCPIQIEDTQIAFFDTKPKAVAKAGNLSNEGYLVYVSANEEAQKKAMESIKKLNCQPNAEGIIVNGVTQKVTVDFSDIFALLPAKLQQPAKNSPFIYKGDGSGINLVNARRLYKP